MRRLFFRQKQQRSKELWAWRPAPDRLRAAASRLPSCPRGKKSRRVEVVLTLQEVVRPIVGQVFTHLLSKVQVEHKLCRHLYKNLTAPEPCQNWTIWKNWESKSTLVIFTECCLSLLYNFAILPQSAIISPEGEHQKKRCLVIY